MSPDPGFGGSEHLGEPHGDDEGWSASGGGGAGWGAGGTRGGEGWAAGGTRGGEGWGGGGGGKGWAAGGESWGGGGSSPVGWGAGAEDQPTRGWMGRREGEWHDRCPFDLCDGGGFVYDEATNTAYDCRCRPQRQAWAKARSLSAVIPRRYRDVSFDRPPVTEIDPAIVNATRNFTARIADHLDAGRGLWFMGPVGTGKTTLAMLVSKAALAAGRSVAIYSLPRLLNEIRDTHRAERSHVALLDRLISVDLLHVDDIGAERSNDWVLEELYSIVNGRYEDRRSMVITTNILDREALCEQITSRTVSRLTEMCDELPLLGHDHRMDLRTA